MNNFIDLKTAVSTQLAQMSMGPMFTVDVDKDELWDTYLNSFPPGSNPIFRERTEHDCSCCRQFIRACGGTVTIVDGELVSIWDIDVAGDYQVVADALSKLVKSKYIFNIFYHTEKKLGTDFNHEDMDGTPTRWDHFFFELPWKFVSKSKDIGTKLAKYKSSKEVFKRGLDEISIDAISTVAELIDQKSIYRGEEHKTTIIRLLKHKTLYAKIPSGKEQDNYCWTVAANIGETAKFRNTVIGTLLVDISEGVPLDTAVKSFETKVAPENYKRPTALITQRMIDSAESEVKELGIESSLQRRYAITDDITINNVLYADKSVKKAMNIFTELSNNVKENVGKFDKVEEVDIDTFIDSILPKASSIELMLENRHGNNLMSLIAPIDNESKPIFKWGNNFSWSYNGEFADSIKERVKNAGGNVAGFLRCSLSWFNYDDLDIHVVGPKGQHIHFGNKRSSITGGTLDVDMNVGANNSRNAVENIVWTDKSKMCEGIYEVYINNYSRRESIDVGFDVEIEFDGSIHSFHYDKLVKGDVSVAKFEYSHENGIKFIESLDSTQSSKNLWSIPTQKFHKVSMIMNSPNHWDGEETGNKHWFFILDKCKNEKESRGFYNEFLSQELNDHRKVFEVLGSKMKTAPSDDQLSGLGFSSTQRNHVLCKVEGAFTRTIKITF